MAGEMVDDARPMLCLWLSIALGETVDTVCMKQNRSCCLMLEHPCTYGSHLFYHDFTGLDGVPSVLGQFAFRIPTTSVMIPFW